jgi:hypothetical protein
VKTTTSNRSTRSARIAGMVIGVGLAIVLIASGRPAAGGGALGAEVSFYANQTGELAISPPGPEDFLRERALMPGGSEAAGEFDVTNQAGGSLELRLSAVGSDRALDDELQVEISSDGRELAGGLLGELEEPTGAPLVLAPGDSATVNVEASLSGDARAAAASLVDVAIGFDIQDAQAGPK